MLKIPRTRRAGLLLVAAFLVAVAAPPTAGADVDPPLFKPFVASKVVVDAGTLEYRAGGRDRRFVLIRPADDGGLVIRDSSLVLVAGGPCRNVSFPEIRCPAMGIGRIRVILNRRDSRVRSKVAVPTAFRVRR